MRFMASIALAVSALALHAAAAPSNQATTYADPPTNFDILKLSIWNRAGYCYSKGGCFKLDVNVTVDTWTIHSFVPLQKDGENAPTNCSTFQFDVKDVKDLEGDLNKFWPNFASKDNATVWNKEFTDRGKCALNQTNTLNSTHDYFKTALDLYKGINITKVLEDQKILPNDTQPVPMSKINDILKTLNFKVELFCEGQKNKTDVLQEVRICLDKQLKAISCPKADEHSTCKTDHIYYLRNSSTLGMPSALLVLFVTLVALFTSKN